MSNQFAGVDFTTVFVGVVVSRSEWLAGLSVAYARVAELIEQNGITARVVPYLYDVEAEFEDTVLTFIERSDRFAQRAIIAGTTTNQLIVADRLCSPYRIITFSVGASATSIIALTSEFACTWMPLDRNIAMFFFMLHCMYERTNAYVVYDLSDPTLLVDVDSMLEDMRIQAAQFQILLCFTTLDAIDTLPENATILLLATNDAIAAAGPARLRCTQPNSSIILMTARNSGARAAWFGDNVVPLAAVPNALDFTRTTRSLVQSIGEDIFDASPFVYAFFDCLYTLAKFELVVGKDFTIENIIKYSVALSGSVCSGANRSSPMRPVSRI